MGLGGSEAMPRWGLRGEGFPVGFRQVAFRHPGTPQRDLCALSQRFVRDCTELSLKGCPDKSDTEP